MESSNLNLNPIDWGSFKRGFTDPRKASTSYYYNKFETALKSVHKTSDILVAHQKIVGVDEYPDVEKATYSIAGVKRYMKFNQSGIGLWRYDPRIQGEVSFSYPYDFELIEQLQEELNKKGTKYAHIGEDTKSLPYESYRLVCLQDITRKGVGHTVTGYDLCAQIAATATEESPVVIKVHPFTQGEDSSVLNKFESDYVRVVHDEVYSPVRLIKGASKVFGMTSSLLLDAMALQRPTVTLAHWDTKNGACGNIGRQNRFLAWYYKVICVDVEADDLEDTIARRLIRVG